MGVSNTRHMYALATEVRHSYLSLPLGAKPLPTFRPWGQLNPTYTRPFVEKVWRSCVPLQLYE